MLLAIFDGFTYNFDLILVYNIIAASSYQNRRIKICVIIFPVWQTQNKSSQHTTKFMLYYLLGICGNQKF